MSKRVCPDCGSPLNVDTLYAEDMPYAVILSCIRLLNCGWNERLDVVTVPPLPEKLKIYVNSGANMSRGKYAAQAVHAALEAFGVHPKVPVIVLGATQDDILEKSVVIRDAGRTEVEPGTVTAGTDWPNGE